MVIDMEEWRDIPKYEGVYQISSNRRVRSLDTVKRVIRRGRDGVMREEQWKQKGKILRPLSAGDKNYTSVHLYDLDHNRRTLSVNKIFRDVFPELILEENK